MAGTANFNFDVLLGRSRRKCIAAGTNDLRLFIVSRVNFRFHNRPLDCRQAGDTNSEG